MDILIGVIIWVCLAALVGKFWDNKGRDSFVGLILSIILSPLVGLLIGVLIAPNTEQQDRNKIETGMMKKCRNCAELVKIDAIVCRFCGYTFSTEEMVPQKIKKKGIKLY